MELRTVTNFKNNTRYFLILSIVVVISSLSFSIFIFLYSKSKIEASRQKIYILDGSGNIYYGQLKNMNKDYRIFEYKDHVRDFYNLFYSFDENNYKQNIEKALWLVGDCGKDLKSAYDEQRVYENVVEKNLKVTLQILSLDIDISKKPYKGIITGIQTISRKGGSVSRHLDCTFTITDALGRSSHNSHGAVINNWKVVNSEKTIKKIIEDEKN